MSNTRPSFEKKEVAISSSPYIYLPIDIPVYTVEITHRNPVDGTLLQRALDRTIRRMPYLSDTFVIEHGVVYYAKNPLPMEAAHVAGIRHVGGSETNYHMLDVTYDGNVTWFSMYHGFCDGQGIYTFLESVLYHYYCMKDGVEYDPNGIRCDSTEATEAETFEPYSREYPVSPGFSMARTEMPTPYHLPEIVPNRGGEVFEYGFSLPSEAFMRFVKAKGASPSVMLSMLVGEAIQRLHPDADAPIFVNIPVSVRRQLGCEETFKNCSSRVVLPVAGTPMDALPFEQLKKPATFFSVQHDTFYIDYIGSMHRTGYSEQITDVRFLCAPAGGKTLHLNIIEHNGEFRITCLACNDIPTVADALEQVLKDHDLPVKRFPKQRFSLPLTAWREGSF